MDGQRAAVELAVPSGGVAEAEADLRMRVHGFGWQRFRRKRCWWLISFAIVTIPCAVLLFFFLPLLVEARTASAAQFYQTLTIYDLLEAQCREGVADMDYGDAGGDAYFSLQTMMAPALCRECGPDLSGCSHWTSIEICSNREQGTHTASQVLRKVEVEVAEYGEYYSCNVEDDQCSYECRCETQTPDGCNHAVGREAIRAYHNGFGWSRAADPSLSPAARGFEREMLFWDYNLARRLDGTVVPSSGTHGAAAHYISLTHEGMDHGAWRNAHVLKTVSASCHQANVHRRVMARGAACFEECGADADDVSSACWIRCFYDTLLGRGSNESTAPVGGMDGVAIQALWTSSFDDEAAGGCPQYENPPPAPPVPPASPPPPPGPLAPPGTCPPDRNLGPSLPCGTVVGGLAARDHRTPSQVCEWLGSLTIGGVQAVLSSWGGSFDVPAGLSASDKGVALCRMTCNAANATEWPC